jgi:hypothetical protein
MVIIQDLIFYLSVASFNVLYLYIHAQTVRLQQIFKIQIVFLGQNCFKMTEGYFHNPLTSR